MLNAGMTTTASGIMSVCTFNAIVDVLEMKELNIFEPQVSPPDNDDNDASFQPQDPVEKPADGKPVDDPTHMVPWDPTNMIPKIMVLDFENLKAHLIPDDK